MSVNHTGEPKIEPAKPVADRCCCVTATHERISSYSQCNYKGKYILEGIGPICGVHKNHVLKHGELLILIEYDPNAYHKVKFACHYWRELINTRFAESMKKWNDSMERKREFRKTLFAQSYGLTAEELDEAVALFKKKAKK
jgi:hypothetical protein